MGLANNFMTSFVEATIHTFKIQAELDVKPQNPYILKSTENILSDISGVIGITSNDFAGTLSIMFPAKVFLGIVSKMLMEECNEISYENESAAGEIANIILGVAKKNLNENHGQSIQVAIPSIITGNNHVIRSMQEPDESFIVPFSCEFGVFNVKISINK